jgi:hypothetical protein
MRVELNEGWRKSSRSQQGGNNCVEARILPDGRPQLSDSKLAGGARPILTLNQATYTSFIEYVKSDSLPTKE